MLMLPLLPVRPPRPLWPLHSLPSKVFSSDHCLLEKEAVKQDAGSVRMNYTWGFLKYQLDPANFLF